MSELDVVLVTDDLEGITFGMQGPSGQPAFGCRAATTGALPSYVATATTLIAAANGALAAQDGITLRVNDYLFVNNETGAGQVNHGPWQVVSLGSSITPFSLRRPSGFLFKNAASVALGRGTQAPNIFVLTTDDPITPGTTPLTFQRITGVGLTSVSTDASLTGDGSAITPIAVRYGTAATTAVQGNDSRVVGAAQKSANLSDLTSISAARTSLGMDTAALHPDTYFDLAGAAATALSTAQAYSNTKDALVVHLAGTETITGYKTFSVLDAITSALSDAATVRHMTSGTAASGIGVGITLAAQNTSGAAVNAARVGGILTTATAGSEAGAMPLYVWRSGALTEAARLSSSGGLSVGNTTASPSAASILIGDAGVGAHGLYVATNFGSFALVESQPGGASFVFGASATYGTIVQSVSNLRLRVGGVIQATFNSNVCAFGNDASVGPGDFTVRGPDSSSGTNIAAANVFWRSGRGRGTGAASYQSFSASIPAVSGTGAHTDGESFRIYGQYVAHLAGTSRKRRAVANVSFSILADDNLLAITTLTGPITGTLPTPGSTGATAALPRVYTIKDESGACSSSNTITLSVTGGATIDGASTLVLNTGLVKVTLYDNGTQYFIG